MTTRDPAAAALAKALVYQQAADAPSTLRAYAADLADFQAWCLTTGLIALPATPEVVGAYLAAKGEGYAKSTLRRRVAAIARASADAGAPLNTKHPAIRDTLRGVNRTHGGAARRAQALTTPDIRRLIKGCGDDLVGRRDRALLLTGFAGALRRSELVALQVSDLHPAPEGLRLIIGRSKTDPDADGDELFLPVGQHPATCPVAALAAWLALADIKAGPVFRKVGRGDKVGPRALSADGVRQILAKRAAEAGIHGTLAEPISPHGLRAGFVTMAYRNQVPDEEIMAHSRHKSLTVMRGYVRRAKLGGKSPAGKVGL